MRLTRIVAERFGRLESVTLGELGEGLNVVLGPNEAGKTSFTALVRYVLYGFPTKRGPEPAYESDAGKRLGRLVFADAAGEWAIERTEGAGGGPVAVHTLAGSDRPDLCTLITDGITRDAFRVVFGFGLGEMAQIESGRGAGLDILSRLYAARAGLGVSPADVRKGLSESQGKLWLKGGQVPQLNGLKSSIAGVKARIADLEAQATEFARERQELADIARRLEEARAQRDEANIRAGELVAALQELSDLGARIAELDDAMLAGKADFDAASDALSRIEVNERTLAVAADLGAVLEDLSAFKQGLERARVQEPRIAEVRARALSALKDAGSDSSVAASADLGPETMAGIKRWSGKLAALESQRVSSERAADAAADTAGAAGSTDSVASTGGRASWVPGAVLVVLGLAIAAWGAVSADYVQAVLGVLVAGTGVALLFRVRATAGPVAERGGGLSAASAAARSATERDAEALEAALAEWRAWLAVRGLDSAGDDPAAVSILAEAFREHRSLNAQADSLEAARDGELQECERYRARLATTASAIVPGLVTGPLSEVAAHAARLREALKTAVANDRQRADLTASVERAARSLKEAQDKTAVAREKAAALLAARGVAGADESRLKAEQTLAADRAREAGQVYEDILRDHTALATHLDSEGRDSAMAQLRLELAGLEERRAGALDRYSVLTLAERLLARAQAYNEQARQPAVIKRASELFETVTAGRYVRVCVPSEGGEFLVYDPESQPTPTSRLSTGTAQQLYLALRIALIETLDEMGPGLPVLMDDVFANFDPDRKLGAARAVAELASHRQVVMFTCHPETAALFESVEPGHTVIPLDACS